MTSAPTRKWDGRATAYAETFAGQCAHTVEPLLDALDPQADETLLDVGTGAGAVAAAVHRRGCAVIAVDPEADMLELAGVAAPGAALVRAALPFLPLPDASVDVVVANFVLNHVPDAGAAMAELRRVLRPGGRLGASAWPVAATPLRALWDDVLADAGIAVPARARAVDAIGAPEGLADLLSGAGLQVREAWLHEFEHVVDPELWWSGPSRGVAGIGQTYLAQDEPGRAAMRASYDRVSRRHLGTDGLLHLRGAAVLAVAVRP
ncbi:MAG TPA: methyltransferase domain-containing protein [Propionicimonas sp.]|nr:methyltransferase domain-containing protein [Propionicimonas sp.]